MLYYNVEDDNHAMNFHSWIVGILENTMRNTSCSAMHSLTLEISIIVSIFVTTYCMIDHSVQVYVCLFAHINIVVH